MSNTTLIFLKKNTKTQKEIVDFFGNENLLKSYNLILDNNNSLPSESYLDNSFINEFIDYFKPKIKKYTNRSLLIKPLVNHKNIENKYKIIKCYPLIKPIFYNKYLGGWITSIDNKNLLKKNDDTYLANDSLSGCTLKYYKNGILMKINNNKMFDKYPKYFMNGYWNKTLDGYIFSKKHKQSLMDMGAIFKK